jgi:hypothetical protein
MTTYYRDDPAIYALRDADGRVFYVGRTTRSIRARWYEHRYRYGFHPGPVYDYWRSVGRDNVTIEELEKGGTSEREVFWIQKLQSEGHPLVNQLSQDGVDGSWSDASKERVGRSNRGKPTWIKGKKGEAAGWTPERRAAQAERIRAINVARAADSQ